MSQSWETPDPVSGAPIGEPTAPDPDGDRAFPREERDRYDIGGLLGRGGMGEVRIARDTRLGRDVALKAARPDGPDLARLAREAAMTARLEHPSIMPVYDAGHDDAGRPYYTMRLLPGRSLAEVLAETPPGPDRLRLVRHLVDAAGALAYAHGRGVLHRDLKPANIMVGAFGETVVSDWGLACTLAEAARPRAGGAGTPGYMSPEQGRGAPLDGRTDVYGLGAVLYEVLVGKPPPPAAEGQVGPVRLVAPDAPPALAAVVDCALRADPTERYATAGAFAEDLLAWYEGRRVSAHAYTARELLARLVAAWRVPLLVGAAGLVALAVALAAGWWRTTIEQERARASEKEAVAAREAEAAALGRALVAQARTAALDGRALEAEVLAANALLRGPSPEARGVLARYAVSARFELVRQGGALPACRVRDLSGDGSRVLCITDDAALLLDPLRPEEPVASTPGLYSVGALARPDRLVLGQAGGEVWDWAPPAAPRLLRGMDLRRAGIGTSAIPDVVAATVGSSDVVIDLRTDTYTSGRACGANVTVEAAVAQDGTLYAGCDDGRVVRGPPGAPGTPFVAFTADDGLPYRIGALPEGGVVVVTTRGWAFVLGPDGGVRARRRFGEDAARYVEAQAGRVALAAVDGNVYVWEPATDTVLARLYAPQANLGWRPDGLLRVLGEHAEDRRVPVRAGAHRADLPGGVAALAFSPAGDRVAVATGDGSASLVDVASARRIESFRWQPGVAKDVAWSPDGSRLAVATTTGGVRVLEVPGGRVVGDLPGDHARRLAWTEAGLLVAAYREEVGIWAEAGVGGLTPIEPRSLLRLEVDRQGRGLALDKRYTLYRVHPGDPPSFRELATVPRIATVVPLGDRVLAATKYSLLWLDPSGRPEREVRLPAGVCDVAVSADGARIAVGHYDGSATIWDADGDAPRARLEGHAARVAALAFSPDGRLLVTGGWDNTVRIWSTAVIDEPAEAIVERVEGAWGRRLDDVLDAPR